MLTAYRFRLYPNKEQQVLLAKHFGCCRLVYNYMLGLHNEEYKNDKNVKWNKFKYIKYITPLKKQEGFIFLKETGIHSLQSAVSNLDNAFQKFFNKQGGYPKFKSRKNTEQSFHVPDKIKIKNNKLYIAKFREGIDVNVHKQIVGTIRNATVKNIVGKYYVSIVVEDGVKLSADKVLDVNKSIGIDVGIKEFAIFSNGDKVDNPRYYVKSQRKLARLARKHSRKVKGSNNKTKSRLKLAKLLEHVANQRKDFHHKLSHKIVNDNQVDIICMEDLNVKGMVKNHCLAKAINDVGWSQFKVFLKYKAEKFGKLVIEIGRFKASSKLCSVCGYVNNELKLSDREWICPVCKTKHDRDINAAINIRNIGISTLGTSGIYVCGDSVRHLTGMQLSLKQEARDFNHE